MHTHGHTETLNNMRAHIPRHGRRREDEPQATGRDPGRDGIHIRHQQHENAALTTHAHKPRRHLRNQSEL